MKSKELVSNAVLVFDRHGLDALILNCYYDP
jgi:hypothetical protein